MYSLETKKRAFTLRRRGFSYTLISQELGVQKATLSGWLSGVPYEPNRQVIARIGQARARAGQVHATKKRISLSRAAAEAAHLIGPVSKRDLLMYGLGLYLGEGGKTADIVRIVNADPRVISAAISWFESLGVRKGQFAPRMYLYPDSDVSASLKFWSKLTGIPPAQFQSSVIDTRTQKSAKNKNKLQHGTLHITVQSGGRKEYGVFFFRKISAMNAEVLRKTRCGRGLPV